MSGSSLTTFYPSLAKLINGDMTERTKVRLLHIVTHQQLYHFDIYQLTYSTKNTSITHRYIFSRIYGGGRN